MILDELTLHDFGVYGGRQSITLTPQRPGRPIILVGGLNGGGKTTLLDALQLCLYGPVARCSNRNGFTYDEYLARCVHRGAPTPEAAVELSFRHSANGVEQKFRIQRSWKVNPNGSREVFEVIRNGELDKLATEYWAEQVEDFVPARIAHLFFFDGEKVESYAELEGAPILIATAIHNLLGLDIVERLTTDLGVLERRKRTEASTPEVVAAETELAHRIAALESERQQLVCERASTANTLDRKLVELAAVEAQYRREGGILFERRTELEREAIARQHELETARKELHEIAAGAAPLLLISDLVRMVIAQDEAEEVSRRNRETVATIAEEHEALLGLPALQELPKPGQRRLRIALQVRLEARTLTTKRSAYLDLLPESRTMLDSLSRLELPAARDRIRTYVEQEQQASAALQHAKDAASSAPNEDAIAGISGKRTQLQIDVVRLRSEQDAKAEQITRLERGLAQFREREVRLSESRARERFEKEDVQRLLVHSSKVRATLEQFRGAIIARHIARIERLVLESFQQLVRKQSLVSSLRIDPVTFQLELRGSDNKQLTPERLSAGERQLLAIAILWGLGRSSGRPLPTVIDTPLGRLDSVHREHLVKRYFPRASHQVLLLSTDEEITGSYYEDLKPAIDRTYHLRFDEAEGRTVIETGYLEKGVSNAH